MEDIQNKRGDFHFKIDKVGVENLEHPFYIEKKDGEVLSTVGNFSMAVSLEKYFKGINMSRLPIIISELYEDNWHMAHYKKDSEFILNRLCHKLETKDANINIAFKYFLPKSAPISKLQGLMPYNCNIEAWLKAGNTDMILTVEVPVTTLCPCSKAISEYSAHNQRGYIRVSIKYKDEIFIEDLVCKLEEVGSCELYPILKRVDEKYVTEKAYENPRFVEDIVRLVAEKLYCDDNITWFKISSHHQESIHPHDAFAVIEIEK